jgi:hypothetical protein
MLGFSAMRHTHYMGSVLLLYPMGPDDHEFLAVCHACQD